MAHAATFRLTSKWRIQAGPVDQHRAPESVGAVYPFAQSDEWYAASIWRAPAAPAGTVTATK